METKLKSLAQIAAELELSRQAVYKRVNSSHDILEQLQPYTVTNGKRKYYTLQGQQIIKDLFLFRQSQLNVSDVNQSEPETTAENSESTAKAIEESNSKSITVNQRQATEVNSKQPTETIQTAITALQQQLTVMDEQLKTKDKQMSELQRQIEQLTVALTSSQQQNRELTETLKDTTDKLTTALSQQQALHAGTIQQQLEQHEPDSELDLPTAPEDQEEQPAPKQEKVSLFKRLFGKRK